MQLSDKQLFEELQAGNYKPVYLLTGEENYYIDIAYDYFERNGHFYFCIGEAKGKGIDASTAMAITRTEFRTLSFDMTNPAEIVSAINKTLIGRNNPNMAVTLLVGVLDIATGRLCYSNAGQTAPMLVGLARVCRPRRCWKRNSLPNRSPTG